MNLGVLTELGIGGEALVGTPEEKAGYNRPGGAAPVWVIGFPLSDSIKGKRSMGQLLKGLLRPAGSIASCWLNECAGERWAPNAI